MFSVHLFLLSYVWSLSVIYFLNKSPIFFCGLPFINHAGEIFFCLPHEASGKTLEVDGKLKPASVYALQKGGVADSEAVGWIRALKLTPKSRHIDFC